MSKWEEDRDNIPEMTMKSVCKPDYEGMKKKAEKRLINMGDFKIALEKFIVIEEAFNRSDLMDLFGHVYFRCGRIQEEIDNIIINQERNS